MNKFPSLIYEILVFSEMIFNLLVDFLIFNFTCSAVLGGGF